MTKLTHALNLAGMGFFVFPLVEGGKTPLIDGFPTKATRDPAQIRRWWTCPVLGVEQEHNIGIYTGRFGDGKALVVVDVDNKHGKRGDDALLELELEGYELAPTLEVVTPTGGRHLFYVTDVPVKQGVNVLGEGLDTRSAGGYVVGVGSETAKGEYRWR